MNAQIKPIQFKAGDILFNENDESFHFYIIQKGQVEVYKTSPAGQKVPLAVVHEGTSIGEFAMIDRLPRSATAQAITDVECVEVSETAYQQLLSDLPEWAVSVMKGLVERLRHTNEIVRRFQVSDEVTRRKIDSAEYDSQVTRTHFIGADGEETETPDLA